MFSLGRKKQVVFYSMDRAADVAARYAVTATRGMIVRNVYTLDRAKVAKLMMALETPPVHLLHAEQILRHELGGDRPYHFITVVTPKSREFGTAKDWFKKEYLPATGIDVQFDLNEISRIYTLGPHKLLLLSGHAAPDEQHAIISKFLKKKIKPFEARHLWHAAYVWFKQGAINAPYKLLQAIKKPDARVKTMRDDLASLQKSLNADFAFSPMATQPAYTPKAGAVLYNAHQTLPFHTSGYATRTHGLVKGLAKQGWNITVVTRAGYPADTHIDAQGQTDRVIDDIPYRCDIRADRGQWDMPLEQYIDASASWLVEQAKDIRPALIHTASNFMCGLAGVEAARRLGIPSIYEMRGLWHVTKWSKDPAYNETERFSLAQKLELDAARAADRVIAITGVLRDWLVDQGIDADKISLAPNAVDLETFVPVEKDIAFAREVGCEGKIVIGYAGSFVAYEGIDLLVQAVALLPQDLRDQIKLLWLGDGPVLTESLGLAASLGVADTIISLGRRPFKDVPRAYSVMDICAFPRKGQPICEIISPLKPFEAMAMEKAVIASDVRPLREIIAHGHTGLLHSKDDAMSLSEQMARFIADADLRSACGKAAHTWVRNTRQWDIIANDIGAIYKELA